MSEDDKNTAQTLEDAELDAVQAGAETVHLYLQSNGEAIDGQAGDGTGLTRNAGLRSDGELVQSVASGDIVMKGKKILQN